MDFMYPVACGADIAMVLCQLVVVGKIIRSEGLVAGVFGLLCGLYAMIWGWRHRKEHDIAGVMALWTTLFVIGGVLQLIVFEAGY